MTDLQLRDLIDLLTRDHDTPVYWHGDLVRYRPDPPLLHALRAARTGNIGNAAAGSGTAAHERTTLNLAASELFTAIQTRVKGWARHADVPRHWALTAGAPVDWTDPAALLRAWHISTQGDPHFDERAYTATLRGWITQIEDLCVDPPRRWPIAAPCPVCNQRWTVDSDGQQIDSLSVTERDPADLSVTACRNCEAVWNGVAGARALRIAIDDAAAADVA